MYKLFSDLVTYTHQLNFAGFKLIVDKDGNTVLKATTKDTDAHLVGKIKQPILEFARPDFERHNSIGFVNLGILDKYLSGSIFDENSKIETIVQESTQYVNALRFTSKNGHTCNFKTLKPEMTKRQIKTMKTPVDVLPTFSFKIDRQIFREFRELGAVLNKIKPTFTFKTQNGNLYIILGDEEYEARIPVCACDVELKREMSFSYDITSSILKQAPSIEDVKITISEHNECLFLEFETEITEYSYTVVSAD